VGGGGLVRKREVTGDFRGVKAKRGVEMEGGKKDEIVLGKAPVCNVRLL